MMTYVKIVSYSVLVNGKPKGLIQPSRGICQGDPLSSFSLIEKVEKEGFIHGFALNRGGSKLTHLLFVDDSLLFCRSSISECQKVLEILASYESLLGLKINQG